ncbi:hypothetical protein F3J45_23550 [Pantoea sp. Ap-967]|uniref:hypothetical protein n=1 Tax=Pantoea sp. Ap-967 TaxID=2608362 RepID=UPI00141FE172|nr:hypothetical protein [Pantoea sp. Ap-967]NIE77416.1 hypothetical protein [Pantoea sp. Ap-967]
MEFYITSIRDWPNYIQWIYLCCPLVMGGVGLLIDIHIAGSRHFTVMCNAFKRSTLLAEELSYAGASLRSRFMVVAGMTSALFWPDIFIGRGQLHPDDNREFPSYLRKRMKLAMLLVVFAVIWSMLSYIFVEM